MSLLSFFARAKAEVTAVFVSLFGKDAAQQFATGTKALLTTALGVLAQDAVAYITATSPNLGGTAARDAASTKLQSDAAAQGKTITTSLANMLIELAVQFVVKGSIVAATTAL